jgi:hypothetical protein
MRTRAPRVDAGGSVQVLPEVEQDVDHARSHLPRGRQRADVVAIADDLPLAPAEGTIDRQRQPDREPVHAPTGPARLVPLHDEVAVILLDGEVDHAESIDRRPPDGAPERPEHPRRSERRKPGTARIVTCRGYRGSTFARVSCGIERRPRGFRPAPFRAPPHLFAVWRGSRSCCLPADLIPRMSRLSAPTASGCAATTRLDSADVQARSCPAEECRGGPAATGSRFALVAPGGPEAQRREFTSEM